MTAPNSSPTYLLVRRARYVPTAFLVLALLLGWVVTPWSLLAIPFIAIGTVFTSPNLNLINGAPSYLCLIAGLVLMPIHEPAGLPILLGTAAGFYGSALEMYATGKAVR